MITNFQKKVLHILVVWGVLAFMTPNTTSFSFELKGFGDVTYTNSTERGNDKDSFSLGMLDLYASQPIDDKMDVFVELVIETDEVTGEPVTDLERFQISYIVNDALKVRVGRFHNILGYWNTAYHHGAQLQTSVDRPAFLNFEDDGGILPAHMVGLWFSGRLKTAPATVLYGVMAGNGSRVRDGVLDPNNVSDDDKTKAASFRLTIEPSAVEGLGVGLSGNLSTINGYDSVPAKIMEVRQGVFSADVTYFAGDVEFIGEYYIINDEDKFVGSNDYSSSAYYAQGGYLIGEEFLPYLRYEKTSVDENDPYFTVLGTKDTETMIGGLRYNLSPASSLKAEVRGVDNGTDKFEEYAIQWAAAF